MNHHQVLRFEARRHPSFVDFTSMSVFMNVAVAASWASNLSLTSFPARSCIPSHDTTDSGSLFLNTQGIPQEKTTVESFQIVIHNTGCRKGLWPF
jgi:hypothetical protein